MPTPPAPSSRRPRVSSPRNRQPLLRGVVLLALLALVGTALVATPASAATGLFTTTGSCVDGGGVTWHTKVVWGQPYTSSGSTKVRVDYAGWTSTLGRVATDSRVRSYNADGRLVSSQTRTETVDYRQGTTYRARNPVNPRSGGARVVIRVGRDGDGRGNCTVTHRQAASADVVVAAVGDMVCPPGAPVTPTTCQHRAVSDSILAARPAAFLALGDNQYGEGTLAQFRQAYAPTFGRLKPVTSPAVGNHEYLTPGAAGYYDYFGTAAGLRSRGYYSQDIGSWHVVTLNSEVDIGATGRQLAWLEADLAAHRNVCTLAVMHKPRYSTGQHGDTAALRPFYDALLAARVELLLSGHDHDYERFRPMGNGGRASASGVTQVVSGAGGKSLYPQKSTSANSVTRQSERYGWLRLTLRRTSAELRFVGVGPGSYTDRSTVACR